jgi:signal recognition particle GTPase
MCCAPSLANFTRAPASLDELTRLAEDFLRSDACVAVAEGVFTTPSLLACEQRILDRARDSREQRVGVLDEQSVGRAIRGAPDHLRGDALNVDQAGAIRTVCTSGEGVDVIVARAGTGKTTALGVIAQAYEQAGYRVVGLAPTAAAAGALDAGGCAGVDDRRRRTPVTHRT